MTPHSPDDTRPGVAVFAPLTYLTVTIETTDDRDDVHLHPGGQGYWIARMIASLGLDPVLAAPLGGESGAVLETLLGERGMAVRSIPTSAPSPVVITDRRTGDRVAVVELTPPRLDRHEMDDLYGAVLTAAYRTGTCVLTGAPEGAMPVATYTRMAGDLTSHGVAIVADIHGAPLDALLDGGPIEILKISHEDLIQDRNHGHTEDDLWAAAAELHRRGAGTVVLSRSEEAALVTNEAGQFRVIPPDLIAADHRGAGDSMTAGFASGIALGLTIDDTLRLGTACAASNVTRHGLGSGGVELVGALVDLVQFEPA